MIEEYLGIKPGLFGRKTDPLHLWCVEKIEYTKTIKYPTDRKFWGWIVGFFKDFLKKISGIMK